MAQDFLSQEEVDALLKGVTGESEETDVAEEHGGGVRNYNLATQERIVRGRVPTMELINERFARYLRVGLFTYMHRNVEVSVGPIKVQKFSEFVRNLVVPTNLNLFTAKPLRGTALIVLDPNLVFLVVDNLFGGDGRFHIRVEGRDVTLTEQRIIQGLLKVTFDEYAKAWAPVQKLEFEYVRSEMHPQFANIATPAEVVVASSFTLEFGGAQAEMHFCFPYSMLEPIRETLYSTMQSDHITQDNRWVSMMGKQLQSAEVTLMARLGTADVTLGDIANMKPGDVIPLNIPEIIQAEVDGIPLEECGYVGRRRQYALKIERFLAQEDDTQPKG